MASISALFQPIKLGSAQLKHRVVLAPMTRLRNDENHVPTDLTLEHYDQRATDGGLLVTEATMISENAGGPPHSPGIYTPDQIRGWKRVTDAVHVKGGVIYNQLWHNGRATSSFLMPNNRLPLAPSAIAITGKDVMGNDWEVPHAMTIKEITEAVDEFAVAAKNAIEAGFDGVEIHGANGFLVDQFINTSSNTRTDQYGGSIENRARFALEVVSAVASAVGEEKTAIRLSPWSNYQDMKDDTPYETWGYIIDQLRERHPKLSYIHMVEPRMNLMGDDGNLETPDSLDPFHAKWPGSFISSGGYTYSPQLAHDIANVTGRLIAFGRAYTSNPDLVNRLKNNWPLTEYDRSTFYGGDARGYTDFGTYTPV